MSFAWPREPTKCSKKKVVPIGRPEWLTGRQSRIGFQLRGAAQCRSCHREPLDLQSSGPYLSSTSFFRIGGARPYPERHGRQVLHVRARVGCCVLGCRRRCTRAGQQTPLFGVLNSGKHPTSRESSLDGKAFSVPDVLPGSTNDLSRRRYRASARINIS